MASINLTKTDSKNFVAIEQMATCENWLY